MVPFHGPRAVMGMVRQVRSTLLASSLRSIRLRGRFDDYAKVLDPKYKEDVLSSVAGVWLPLEVAAAHYEACDRLGYTPEPRDSVYRPSVDVFLHSVCRLWAGDAVGVLLTGMGRDGALGLKALRRQGHLTIAQDRATSAVYGMPKAAAALEAAVDILALERIAPRLVDAFAESP